MLLAIISSSEVQRTTQRERVVALIRTVRI